MSAVAAEPDSVRVYYHDGITVHAKKHSISRTEFPVEKGTLGGVLEKNGFSVIRKGVFLAQDVYADGMKKSDIPVVVDDERYQCACPNRMDAPVSRISPLDIESVELDKSASNLQAGLGGAVLVRRSEPQDSLRYRGSLTQYMGSFDGTDGLSRSKKTATGYRCGTSRGSRMKTVTESRSGISTTTGKTPRTASEKHRYHARCGI